MPEIDNNPEGLSTPTIAMIALAGLGALAISRPNKLVKPALDLTESTSATTSLPKMVLQAEGVISGFTSKQASLAMPRNPEISARGDAVLLPSIEDCARLLDKAIPVDFRVSLASRSSLYDKELAAHFRNDFEKAFPNIEQRISKSLGNRNDAVPPQRTRRYRWDDPIVQTYEKQHRASETMLREATAALEPVFARFAREIGVPKPSIHLTESIRATAIYKRGSNSIFADPNKLTEPGSLARTSYHELTHAEQTNLLSRRIADKLQLPAKPTGKQMDNFIAEWAKANSFESKFASNDISERMFARNSKQYLEEVVQLRNGQQLPTPQAARADALVDSYSALSSGKGQHAMPDFLASNPQPENVFNFLLYRSRLHEIEAFETERLVPIGRKITTGRRASLSIN